ncbi:hypothetical protein GCM10027615_78250 [Plantactinospora veratri]
MVAVRPEPAEALRHLLAPGERRTVGLGGVVVLPSMIDAGPRGTAFADFR